jgi:hypothetical protein
MLPRNRHDVLVEMMQVGVENALLAYRIVVRAVMDLESHRGRSPSWQGIRKA